MATAKKKTTETKEAVDATAVIEEGAAEIQRLGGVIVAKANLELAELGLPPVTLGGNKLEGFNVRGSGKSTDEMMADALRKGAKAASKGRPAYNG